MQGVGDQTSSAAKVSPPNDLGPRMAVLIPCYNEAVTIARVVSDFRNALPGAEVWVCDNNSRDASARVAAQAGAHVRIEALRGKGYAVRRMFGDIDADAYVLVGWRRHLRVLRRAPHGGRPSLRRARHGGRLPSR